jgi:DNA-binding NarL/FixJ family response regulator
MISAVYAAGAFGFFVKGQPLRSLIESLKDIAAGRSEFSPNLAKRLVSPASLAAPWRDETVERLAISPREEQILSRYGQGFEIAEIAGSIGLSPATVGAFLTNILHKLHEQALLDELLGQGEARDTA